MRVDAQPLENERLRGLELENYPWYHERHRIFPEIFEHGKYKRVIDISAGIGIVAKRIKELYADCTIIANDISEESLRSLRKLGLETTSFDLDNSKLHFPFEDESFDAVISLATLEHIIDIDHHMQEIRRILKNGGDLFLSVPNYSGIHFVIPFVLKGKTFHDFTKGDLQRYEFYAHVRYFTYLSLIDFVKQFGFEPVNTYLPLPKDSSKFRKLKKNSPLKAFVVRNLIKVFYRIMHPRWAFHPVLQFKKVDKVNSHTKPRKIIL
ncbi:MAG: class I SAM-dependent methyltransferase [Ignavibacterium album]|uniref:class I SAM-dependent methyltransferase n=1 Tax=Ignavibacterium album TaxID=591197 RepID=UPI0026F09CBE|nr:class I SAM-dependent methyltransferase [Ignavibacterium album]MBI5661149.1 class I SAM-dependent methyltransferase [Ignavibacterium album]